MKRSPMSLTTLLATLSLLIVGIISSVFLYLGYAQLSKNLDNALTSQFNSDAKLIRLALTQKIEEDISEFLEHASLHAATKLGENGGNAHVLSGDETFHNVSIDFCYFHPADDGQSCNLGQTLNDKEFIASLREKGIDNYPKLYEINYGKKGISVIASSKKAVSPNSGRVLGSVSAGIVLNDNFLLASELRELSDVENLALLYKNRPLAYSLTNLSEQELYDIAAKASLDMLTREGGLAFVKKESGLQTKDGEKLSILIAEHPRLFDELKKDSAKTVVAVLTIAILLFLILQLILNEMFVSPFKKVHAIALLNPKTDEKVSFHPGLIKELNDVGNSLSTLIYTLQENNVNLQKKIDEEIEKVKIQEEIIHEQNRYAALSELLVNIAHQWRQPLNIMSLRSISIAEELSDEKSLDSKKRGRILELSEKICAQTQELSGLITEFTSFYEQEESTPYKLKSLIASSIKMVNTGDVKLILDIDKEIEHRGGQKAFAEAIVAIVKNSIEISQTRTVIDPIITIVLKEDSNYILVEIEDNCGGIDKDILPKIFYPYTTSFFKSKHKGLGLYLANNLVKYRLNGEITVQNGINGAKFTIKARKNG